MFVSLIFINVSLNNDLIKLLTQYPRSSILRFFHENQSIERERERENIEEETGEARMRGKEHEDAHLLMVATPASANQLRRRGRARTPQ